MHEAIVGLLAAPLAPAMAVLAGAALGLVFYAGLWWTVRRAATFRRPAFSVLTSLLLRMGIALGGFYLVAEGRWTRLLLCLAGFVIARAIVTWLSGRPASRRPNNRMSPTGARHAP